MKTRLDPRREKLALALRANLRRRKVGGGPPAAKIGRPADETPS